MKLLILGHRGMLGSMLVKYFNRQGFEVQTSDSRYGDPRFLDQVVSYKGDYIVNCVGAIPQRTNDFKINTDLPIWLSNHAPCRVVHPGTDCELDSDRYGISKRIANEYIQMYSENTKILKTSIIGPEQGTCFGLMEWFLNQEGVVKGYTNAVWNGNTTLEWAKQCHGLMSNWDSYKTETILEGEPISKYNMLLLFKRFYKKDIEIEPVDLGKNKCLRGCVKTIPLEIQLEELKQFTDQSA